jgi:hypothetical protein
LAAKPERRTGSVPAPLLRPRQRAQSLLWHPADGTRARRCRPDLLARAREPGGRAVNPDTRSQSRGAAQR